MPGFIDMHGHIGGEAQGVPAEYVFKLWLGHGITTISRPIGRQWIRLGVRTQRKECQK